MKDASSIVVEVLPLTNFVRSEEEHQDRLTRIPDEACHISKEILYKYRLLSSNNNLKFFVNVKLINEFINL